MKKVLSILLIIMLIITFIQIRNMYALYKDQLSGEYSTSLGKWNVEVNGTDIVSPGQVVEFEMLDGNIEYLDNDFKSSGAAIVPNTEAFFDILFNTSNTQVAVKYIIEFGEINSYNVINNSTGDFVVDTTDDDEDDSEDDYEFSLNYPLKFEIQEMLETFGNYSLSSEEGNEGKIIGTETTEEYEAKTKCDAETSTAKGVIPLEVSQANLQSQVRVKFKWVIDEDTISADDEKTDYEDMYQYMMSRNNEEESVKLIIPVKVKAIQYLGEDL